ncbi:MAG: tyrosine--tRNA ligase [Chloroflexi bacterium]|nr:tyrosine--tRNA ligase [Chloroflexota bacterium]
MKSAEEQLKVIADGTEEVIPGEELKEKIERSISSGEPLRVKYGADPTAPDLHLGHAVPLRKLRQFQELGHRVTLLIGDYTARVGDPSGRSATRPQLPPEAIKANARTYTDQAFKILDDSKTDIDYNSRWFSKMGFDDLLRLTAQFTVARLLERDDFAMRYAEEIPVGLHELLYPIMQAYDSVALKSDVEMGGTDQKFNMLGARDLQRFFGQEPQAVITMPLLEGLDGVKKMSKSLGNYIGLTEPADEMFGKVMSLPDAMMPKYFKLTTAVPAGELASIDAGLADGSFHPGEAKRRLAREIIAAYHSIEEAFKAEGVFNAKFRKADGKSAIERLAKLEDFEIPEAPLVPELFKENHIWIVRLMTFTGVAQSNSEARRLIEQGAVKINDEAVSAPDAEVVISDGDILQVGKRKFIRLLMPR